MDLETTLKIIEKLATTFGPIVGTLLFFLIIIIAVILFFFQKRIAAIAQEISDKSVSAFNKRIDLLFRDEILRNNLRSYLGQKSVEKKLALYEEVYTLYFQYQKHWFSKNDDKTFKDIFTEVAIMRQKIFLNSIYLGGALYNALLSAVIGMLSNLQDRGTNPPAQVGMTGISTSADANSEIEITKSLDEASRLLEKHLFTHQDVSMYEFNEEQSKALQSEKDYFIKNPLPR